MTTGTYPWEEDGYPFGSPHAHAASFWNHRHLPNILMVHYNDMKTDLEGEMRRIAAFCGIDVPEETWPSLVDGARFETMKRDASKLVPGTARAFKGGVETFIYKGTGGRWRNVLTDAELDLYEMKAERLDPALRSWLESGRVAAGDPEQTRP
jgi:aryl sulfotransferase